MFPLPTAKSLRFSESGVVPIATAIREIETHFETRRFDVSRNGSAQIVADGVTGLLADATWILEIPLFESFPHHFVASAVVSIDPRCVTIGWEFFGQDENFRTR